MSMYADDSPLYMSATTATKMTTTLKKELQLVSEWVKRNTLVLNISKTESIVFGTNNSLNPKPQLNLVMNNVEIEQVEETKRLGLTLECKLSWSKHIDTTIARMGRILVTSTPTPPNPAFDGRRFANQWFWEPSLRAPGIHH